MARTYKRDSRGRFASGGSARSAPKARVVTGARAVSGGRNRLTRDNAGRITSVGGQGATARGGRLRTASGAKRGAVMVRMKGTGGKLRKPIGGGARVSKAEPLMTGGTLAARSSLTRARRKLAENATPAQRGAVTRAKKYAAQSYDKNTQPRKFGRPASVMRKRPPESPLRWQVEGGKAGALKPRPQATQVSVMPRPEAKPPRIADTMRETMRALAQSDARFYRSLEKDLGIKVKVPKTSKAATTSRANIQSVASNTKSVSQTLRAGLRELARSDAQRLREIQDITRETRGNGNKLSGGKSNKRVKGSSRKRLKGGS